MVNVEGEKISYGNGTRLILDGTQGSFEVYGRLREKRGVLPSWFDSQFRVISSSSKAISITRTALTQGALRSMQLGDVLGNVSRSGEIDPDLDSNNGRFELLKIIATDLSLDGQEGSISCPVESMQLEIVVPKNKKDKAEGAPQDQGQRQEKMSNNYMMLSGSDEICLLRGSISFVHDRSATDKTRDYELLVDGIDLISADIVIAAKSSNIFTQSSTFVGADKRESSSPLLVGDHSKARTRSSSTNPLILMVALFAMKLWFLSMMVIITAPSVVLQGLSDIMLVLSGFEWTKSAEKSVISCDSLQGSLVVRSVKAKEREAPPPVIAMKLLAPTFDYVGAVTKWFRALWALSLVLVALVATFSLLWDVWSYWRIRAYKLRHKKSKSQSLVMLVHAYNSWGFCGAVEKGMALPFYGMPSTFVQAFHDGSPALSINAGSVPLTIGLALWRFLKCPWSLFKRLNTPSRLGTPSTKKRPPTIASDMYTLVADRSSRSGFVCGFLSQKQQFGCISLDESYSKCLVRCACDGVVVCSSKNEGTHTVTTDWLWLEAVPDIDAQDPLAMYMDAAGRLNRARLCPPRYCHPPHPHYSSSSPAPLLVPGRLSRYGDSDSQDEHDRSSEAKKTWQSEESPSTSSRKGGTDLDDLEVTEYSSKFSPLTPPSGWCSWYHFFERVTEADLVENISLMRDLKEHHHLHARRQGFSLFQVDDGYQKAWGDWLLLDRKKFPSESLATVVDLIQGAGMTAGLWLAPFSCDKHSLVAKEHPEWILRNQRGVAANSANCGKFFYGLDTTHPGVRDYLKVVLSTVTKTWGFSYLKLDFLYSSILPDAFENFHNRTKTRAQVFSEAMEMVAVTLEEEQQESYLLGCGSPLGAMIGHVHANRVSPDAGLAWLPEFPLPWWDRWNLPSARGMLRNTLSRLGQHGRWWCNDPDCMLLRTSTTFTEVEIVSILTVKALSGGSFILSDDLSQVPPHRVRLAQQVLPATNLAAVPVDIIDAGMPERLRLPLGRGSERERSGTGTDVSLGMGLWTLFAACHWDEDNRYDYYDPQPVLPGSSRKTRSNPFAWVMLERKSHRVSLQELLGPRSAHLEAIRRKFTRNVSSHTSSAFDDKANTGVVLFLYDFWEGECYTVDVTPSTLRNEVNVALDGDISTLSLVLPPVERRGVRLLSIRAASMIQPSNNVETTSPPSERGRIPTVFTHRHSVAGVPSDSQDPPTATSEGSTPGRSLSASDGKVLYPSTDDSDNDSELTEHQEDDDETEDGSDSDETTSGHTETAIFPVYLGSNLHFSCGLELAEMVVLSRIAGKGSDASESSLNCEKDGPSRRLFEEDLDSSQPKEAGNHPSFDHKHAQQGRADSERLGQCCVLTFHEGIVRPKSWGGFFLLLVPCLSMPAARIVVTTCTVPATHTSVHRQCVEDGISSPHKELRDKDHTDMYLGIDGAPGGERMIPLEDVEVVKHCAAGTVIKVLVGDDDAERLAGHFGPKGHERAHWATRIMIHY